MTQSPKLSGIPFHDLRSDEQRGDRADSQEDAKRQIDLQVAPALYHHYHNPNYRTRKHAYEDGQNCQTPTEIGADHEHHLYVTQPHRFDATQLFPGPTHQPERAAA